MWHSWRDRKETLRVKCFSFKPNWFAMLSYSLISLCLYKNHTQWSWEKATKTPAKVAHCEKAPFWEEKNEVNAWKNIHTESENIGISNDTVGVDKISNHKTSKQQRFHYAVIFHSKAQHITISFRFLAQCTHTQHYMYLKLESLMDKVKRKTTTEYEIK